MQLVEAPAGSPAVDAETAGAGPDRAGQVRLVDQIREVDLAAGCATAAQLNPSHAEPGPNRSGRDPVALGQLPQRRTGLIAAREFLDRHVNLSRHATSVDQ